MKFYTARMEHIIECVPNFSTADFKVISAISSVIKSTPGVKLLNVEPDVDYNRTVVTFVGSPETVGDAAIAAIGKASELIDMTKHKGEHPRMGATDVCPFIPVKGVSVEECIVIAKDVAKQVAEKFGVPTYLYEKAATSEDRVKMSNIRKGQYEGFAEKIKLPEWKPDYGEAVFNAKSGATVIGVRDFLVAYNINIESADVSIAKEIGGLIRESGRLVENEDGEKVRIPGLLKSVQGMGFTLERGNRKLTQVSTNVLNFREHTAPHIVFEEVKRLAEERGTTVTGSEIVGLIPIDAMLLAGKYYNPEEEDRIKLVQIALDKLGLSDLDHFDPYRKVIELMIESESLVDLSVDLFIDDLASDKPAPGGGSVAALGGSLAAALTTMVCNLTVGREKFAEVEEKMDDILQEASKIQLKLTELVDDDTRAFNEVMNSFRMSKDDPNRPGAIQKAMIQAAKVPLEVAEYSDKVLDLAYIVAQDGNKNAITDIGVGALFAESAVRGALLNVRINLGSIKDEEIKGEMNKRVSELLAGVTEKKDRVISIVEKELS